ncbi:MAG: hypothetical protein KAT11_02255, partial [Phycisphaerae bacterium]|nr:hypothetical protein [Phycisphaerae bacterium]
AICAHGHRLLDRGKLSEPVRPKPNILNPAGCWGGTGRAPTAHHTFPNGGFDSAIGWPSAKH